MLSCAQGAAIGRNHSDLARGANRKVSVLTGVYVYYINLIYYMAWLSLRQGLCYCFVPLLGS